MSKRWLVGVVALAVLLSWSVVMMAGQAKPNQIKFFHAMGGSRIPVIERMVADFNATHPDIEVTAVFNGSYRDNLQKTIEATAAGDTKAIPNIAQIFDVGTQEVLDSGVFALAGNVVKQCIASMQDLNSKGQLNTIDQAKLGELEGFNTSNFIPAIVNYYRAKDGTLTSFPWNSSNPIVFYNKTIFDKFGITMPEKPTFQDIIDIGNKLKATGQFDKGVINWPNHSWFVEEWFAEQGQDLVNNGNGRQGRPSHLNFDSKAAKTLYNWWGTLVKDGLYTNPGFEAWDEADRLFLAQQDPIEITSTSEVTILARDAFNNGFEVGTAFLPVPDNNNRNGVIIGGAALWLPAKQGAQNLCDAATFSVWMSETAQTIRWHQQSGYFPVTTQALSVLQAQGTFKARPNLKTALDQLTETKDNSATNGARIGAFLKVRTIVEHGFESLEADIKGGMPVVQAVDTELKAIGTKADKAICDYQKSIGVNNPGCA